MKIIKQSVTFKATPHEVYELFMDSKKHTEFSGDKAVISRKPGGKFSAFSGYATGHNVELVPDGKIVQTWYASDWPEGTESTITLVLTPAEGGTKLAFSHTGVPDEFHDGIKQGWIEYYWNPMKAWIAEHL